MKIIFLDIDGVLNSLESSVLNEQTKALWDYVDPLLIKRLNKIFDLVSDVKIVISSSWRKLYTIEEIKDMFVSAGLRPAVEIIGKTVNYITDHYSENPYWEQNNSGYRGWEVYEWLSKHPEVTNYAILDDDSDFLEFQMPHFVNTSAVCGLTFADMYRVIKILDPENDLVKSFGGHIEFTKKGDFIWKSDREKYLELPQ